MLLIPNGCDRQVFEQLNTRSDDNISLTVKGSRYNITRPKNLLLQNYLKCELCHDWATFYTDTATKCIVGRADNIHTDNPRQAKHIVITDTMQWLSCNKCKDLGLRALNKMCCLYGSVTLDEYKTSLNVVFTESQC